MSKKRDKHPSSVASAIFQARFIYAEHKNAGHPAIEAFEEWVNYSPNARASEIAPEIAAGRLRKSQTSGRLFIQVARA